MPVGPMRMHTCRSHLAPLPAPLPARSTPHLVQQCELVRPYLPRLGRVPQPQHHKRRHVGLPHQVDNRPVIQPLLLLPLLRTALLLPLPRGPCGIQVSPGGGTVCLRWSRHRGISHKTGCAALCKAAAPTAVPAH